MVVDSKFEASRTPIDELNGATRLDTRDGLVGVSGDNVTAVQERAGHVVSGTGVTDDHLVVGFEALEGDILNPVAFMLRLGFGNNWGAGDEGVVDSRVGYQVGLEFCEIDVQGSFETEGGGDARDDYARSDLIRRKWGLPCAISRLRFS